MAEHYTHESDAGLVADGPDAVEEARKQHHLATADPEPERDGLLTGPAHEEKYGLERAAASAEQWRAAGVHPTENRALETADASSDGKRTTAASRASDEK